MNGKMLLAVCPSVLLAGCVGAALAQEVECQPVEFKDEKCQGDKHYPVVLINTMKVNVDRINVCAARNSTIEFRVVPPGRNVVGSVAIKPKDDDNLWLLSTNSPNERVIRILVPDWVDDNTDHDYTIYLPNGVCIDPRVHVED